jgi:hypothetical protein
MKKNEKKIGGIKGFFMWLFRMDRTITEVEVSNEPAPDVPMSFGETVKHVEEETAKLDNKFKEEEVAQKNIKDLIGLHNKRKEDNLPFCDTIKKDSTITKTKLAVSSVKQNLSKKYNPNVKRGKDGRFKSLK